MTTLVERLDLIAELALLFCDLALLTFVAVVPNPFGSDHWPVAVQYHIGNFIYFFVLLSGATLAYSWRTVIAVGTWMAALDDRHDLGVVAARSRSRTDARVAAAVVSDERLFLR